MKTTIEIPDPLFRRAKSRAAERGQTLKALVTEALQEKLAVRTGKVSVDTNALSWIAALALQHRLPVLSRDERACAPALPEIYAWDSPGAMAGFVDKMIRSGGQNRRADRVAPADGSPFRGAA